MNFEVTSDQRLRITMVRRRIRCKNQPKLPDIKIQQTKSIPEADPIQDDYHSNINVCMDCIEIHLQLHLQIKQKEDTQENIWVRQTIDAL